MPVAERTGGPLGDIEKRYKLDGFPPDDASQEVHDLFTLWEALGERDAELESLEDADDEMEALEERIADLEGDLAMASGQADRARDLLQQALDYRIDDHWLFEVRQELKRQVAT